MSKKSVTIRAAIITGVFILLAAIPNAVWAEEAKSTFMVSKPQVLHTLAGYGSYDHYENAEVFVDANDRIIVFSCFAFKQGGEYRTKILLFVLTDKTWSNSELILPGIQIWQGMINNGKFGAYTRSDSLEIYGLASDMRLSSRPTKIIKMDANKKAFKQESRRYIRELLPLENHPDKFFIVGEYSENRLNPIDLIGRVMSAGHWGFVRRIFGATSEQGQISGYYSIPQELKTNECMRSISCAVDDDKVHTVWLKDKEYSHASIAISYSSFNFPNKHWTGPVQLFRANKTSEKLRDHIDGLSLACDDNKLYCCWARYASDLTSKDDWTWTKRAGECGIYLCSRIDNQWTKPIIISDSGDEPQVVIDNNGTVFIFWVEEKKGLFYKYKTKSGWSATHLAIKDRMIRRKGFMYLRKPSYSVFVDQHNALHIVYTRKSSGNMFREKKLTPEKLFYITLTPAQK